MCQIIEVGDTGLGSIGEEMECAAAINDSVVDVYVIGVDVATKSGYEMVEEELSSFKKEPIVPLNGDPLCWWKINVFKYPLITKVAKYYLGVPGTSIHSEQVFSTAGDDVTAQRTL